MIEAWKASHVEVLSTTPFLPFPQQSGITDLALTDTSRLDYYGGETEELTLQKNATAQLRGGRIDFISSLQYATTEHIFIWARDGWEWKYENGEIRGITGLWYDDGTLFDIRFTKLPDWMNFDPAWMNVKVIPEPATLLFMALGGLLVRQRHRSSYSNFNGVS